MDEEHKKCEQLTAQNNALRQQLEESNHTNEALTNDLQKLTNDWSNMRDELMAKEDEFKEEEQVLVRLMFDLQEWVAVVLLHLQAFKDYCNSEHNRLLKMWREVVAVKRAFGDIETAMKNEVSKMGLEINSTTKELLASCGGVAFNVQQAKRVVDEQLLEAKRESDSLQSQLATLKVQHESARHEILERDQRLLELMNQLKKLEDRCGQAESQAMLANRYNDEIERLNNSIREIAQAVVLDAEIADRETTDQGVAARESSDMHTARDSSSAIPTSATKSGRRSSSRTSHAFAESTISAVQAALHKYQLALHDMQVKFQNTDENLRSTRTQLDTSEGTKALLTTKIQQLTEKLDASNSKLSELLKERDSLQKTLDEIRQQKQQSELGKAELNNAVYIR